MGDVTEFDPKRRRNGKPPKDWREHLVYVETKSGRKILPVAANAIAILGNDPAWTGKLAWDSFRQSIVVTDPPWDELDRRDAAGDVEFSDSDVVRVQAWLQRHYDMRIGREPTWDAVQVAAERRVVHPVCDYLDGLAWDGTQRIDSWLSSYVGADRSQYSDAVGRSLLIAAVARARTPGCKVDTMAVLEGAQGIGKSTALRTLFTQEWFADSGLDLESKDRFVGLRGAWGVELPELDSLRRSDTERIKSFLSSPVDTYRPPYGRGLVRVPRGCVIIGTTNSDTYLQDSTGNRRFLPVRCGRVDLAGIARDRDQLWAEAKEAHASGATWWEIPDAETEQRSRLTTDAWEEPISGWLARQGVGARVVVGDVLDGAIGLEKGRWDQAAQNRVARVLAAMGWHRMRRRDGVNGERRWAYERGVVPNPPASEDGVGT